ALLHRIARRCVEEKLGRLEWSVLDWNENAIRFYESTGARVMEEWRICRLNGLALHAFAADAPEP
ncbi:MAG: GNAT family N-acetyltransferase, partial [Methylovirgula sp.]